MPLLSHYFPIVLRHIPSFVHCLSQISDIWHEDCIAYKIWAKTELLHITCVSSPHIETAIFPLLFHYAIQDHKNALNLEQIRYAAHLAKKYHHGTSAHHMVLIKTAIFPLLFQCFTRALRDLASFYPLLIVSTVVINFPSVLLKFAIAFPFFSHCSLFIPNFRMKIALLTKFGHITCVSSPHIETAIFPLLFHYAIMVPHRSLNFTWHHFTLSLFFPPFFLAYQFSKRSTQIFHCFPIFSHCFIS